MKPEYTYLIVNLLTVLFPFIFTFHKKIRFYKLWKYVFPAIILTAIPFIIWDMIFTQKNVWHFNENLVTGIKIINLPIEEVLFFITIPYASLFLYEAIWRSKLRDLLNRNKEKIIIYVLEIVLVILIIIFYSRLYTFFSCLFLLMFLVFLQNVKSELYKGALLTYAILLVPFFIVNGYLTGMFTQNPVVLYDNSENIGIRIITIPAEDAIYGMLLFMMNVFLFNFFKKTINQS